MCLYVAARIANSVREKFFSIRSASFEDFPNNDEDIYNNYNNLIYIVKSKHHQATEFLTFQRKTQESLPPVE